MKNEFNTLVENEYTPLRRFALKLTNNAEDANDLVQETMLKAFRYQEMFENGTNLKGWLYTIMKNIFINNYRRMVKGRIFSDDSDNQYYINSASHSSNNDAESRIRMEEITNAISKLTTNLRVPFMMSYTGYKYEEIAEQLHVPLGTVKIRIHCARQKLKTALKAA